MKNHCVQNYNKSCLIENCYIRQNKKDRQPEIFNKVVIYHSLVIYSSPIDHYLSIVIIAVISDFVSIIVTIRVIIIFIVVTITIITIGVIIIIIIVIIIN